MPRYRVTLEYDGTPFAGWQFQPDQPTVQGRLAEAIRRFTGETVKIGGAGRTDAGVHALGQVAHFDLAKAWTPHRVREALNHHLRPEPVAVIACAAVADTFDARFSATGRRYLYRILPRRAPPVLDAKRVWWVPRALDADAMAAAARVLVGRHDFTTFRVLGCQSPSPLKTLDRLDVARVGDEVHVYAAARSFLHSQVRSMVGTLKLVGEARSCAADVADRLAARDRARCGPVAPPEGLYLTAVGYDVPTPPTGADPSNPIN